MKVCKIREKLDINFAIIKYVLPAKQTQLLLFLLIQKYWNVCFMVEDN